MNIEEALNYIRNAKDYWAEASDYDKKEQKDFVESLSSQNFQDIQAFLGKQPALEHDIIYDADGEMKTRTLRGLFDFFTSA